MGRVKKQFRIDATTLIYQTNCLYADNGQVIVARDLGDGRVLFADISRYICGIVTCQFVAKYIEEEYLYNRYSCDYASHDFQELCKIGNENQHHVPCTR